MNTFSEVVLLTKSYKECDIDEFVKHYLFNCGFDHITIYDNETVCCNIFEKFKDNKQVTVIPTPSPINHLKILTNHHKLSCFNWQFYVDDDEFLWIDKTKISNINEFLQFLDYKHILQFGVYWQYISYESGKQQNDRNQCFTKECFYIPSRPVFTHLKSFVNKNAQNGYWPNPHMYYSIPVHTFGGITHSPNCIKDVSNDPLKLYHYFYRTKNEWNEKLKRIRPDTGKTFKDQPTSNGNELIYNKYISIKW